MNFQELKVKIASASIGSLLVSLTTTPLDVLKTRLQSGHVNTSIRNIIKHEGIKALWRGLTPSLLMVLLLLLYKIDDTRNCHVLYRSGNS
jgi:hypothetical protein